MVRQRRARRAFTLRAGRSSWGRRRVRRRGGRPLWPSCAGSESASGQHQRGQEAYPSVAKALHRIVARGGRPHRVRSGRDRRGVSCSLRRSGCIRRAVRPMKTEARRVCPSCRNEFPGPVEFCPVCMLHRALASGVESGESFAEDAVVPTSKDVTQRFEHYELMSEAKMESRSSWAAARWG